MPKVGAVLVVGAGVGGIKAALELAELGFRVYLLDKSPNIGGTLAQLDKQFPTDDCGMCKMLPVFTCDEASENCLRRELNHPNIEVLSNSVVKTCEGSAGEFKVKVLQKPKYVKEDRCIICGLCVPVCPVEVEDEFNEGLGKRKAIYLRYPLGVPYLYTIDMENCTKCGECIKVCPTDAIDLSQQETEREIEVGAVILSPGFEEFDPTPLTQYGYGKFPNVVTSIELERLLSGKGPHSGEFARPSDGKIPKNVAFLQCIGSRDEERDYCSSACCMYAMKEATLLKEKYPDIEPHIFFMDLRAFGKGYHRYYLRAKDELGIGFTRSRVSAVEDSENGNLRVLYETDDGKFAREEFDLVVLSTGQTPSPETDELGKIFAIELNQYGFVNTKEFSQVETLKKGVYVCGPFSSPTDIPETVVQGQAAALKASSLLTSSRGALTWSQDYPEEIDVSEQEPNIGVFVCKCGKEVANSIDMDEVLGFAKGLPQVSLVEVVDYLCLTEDLKKAKEKIRDAGINRVVFAACAPHPFEIRFKKSLKEVGLNPSLLEIVNLREQLSWTHDDKAKATAKAKSLIWMASEKLRWQEPLPVVSLPVKGRALVIGGGIAGMTAASAIAEQGFEVDLLERTSELGGNLREVHYTLGGLDPQVLLRETIDKLEKNPLIHIHKETGVETVTGYAGNFKTILRKAERRETKGESSSEALDAGEVKSEKLKVKSASPETQDTGHTTQDAGELDHGAIVIATGGKMYEPKEYLYGKDKRVITQRELEKRLANPNGQIPNPNADNSKIGNWKLEIGNCVVMIQCVGSRDDEHPYCSRICCSQAIKNALKLKGKRPETEVYVLYRDVMTYGFLEEYFTEARKKGVIFLRYELEEPPEVSVDQGELRVKVRDPILDEWLLITPDLLVLSPGITPNDNSHLATTLSLPLNEDGFFEEANVKFRPLDFMHDGVYLCGLAHSPRSIPESIDQAYGAATRAISLLCRKEISSRRAIAEVSERWCVGCELCIEYCPYDARVMDEERKIAVVRETICQGCGVCQVVCPSSASKLRSFKDPQVLAMIHAGLGG